MSDAAVKPDGRRLRTEKTRLAIAKAMTDLMSEGRAAPTREEIATRAGISVRALFLHFPNVHDLIAAELDRVHETLLADPPILPSMPLAERVAAFVARRAAALARLAPHLSAATVDRSPDVPLQDRIDRANRFFEHEVRQVFDAELAAMPPGERDACSVALEILLSPATWETMARERGFDRQQAGDVLATVALRLLDGPRNVTRPRRDLGR